MVRLEDVFQRFPRTPVSVEIKKDNEELIHKVLLRGAGRGWATLGKADLTSLFPR